MKTVFFDLFLFTTGYKVGPQFFRGLKRDAIPQVALTVVLCVTCLLTAFGVREAPRIRHRDGGGAAGGGVLGVHGDRHRGRRDPAAGDFRRGEDRAHQQHSRRLCRDVPHRHRRLVWFLPTIGPKLMGINLREEGARQQAEIAGSAELGLGVMSAARHFDVRAYRVTNPSLVNKTVAELEALPKDTRVFIVRIRRGGRDRRGHARPRSSARTTSLRSPPGKRFTWSAGPRSVPRWTTRPCSTFRSRRWTWWSRNRAFVGKTSGGAGAARVRPRGVPAKAHPGRAGDADRPPERASIGATCCV